MAIAEQWRILADQIEYDLKRPQRSQ